MPNVRRSVRQESGGGSGGQAMPKRRKINEEDRYRLWWETSFKEREELLRERFGQTDPPVREFLLLGRS